MNCQLVHSINTAECQERHCTLTPEILKTCGRQCELLKSIYNVFFLKKYYFWQISWAGKVPYFYRMCTLNRKHYMITPAWNKVQKPPREIWFALQLRSNLKLITDNASYSYQTSCIWRFTQTKQYSFRIQIILACSPEGEQKVLATIACLWITHEQEMFTAFHSPLLQKH